jgi:hypothetical protein
MACTMIKSSIIVLVSLLFSPSLTLSFVSNSHVARSRSALLLSVDSKSSSKETGAKYPLGVREMLLKKAKNLDVFGYSPSGWSNRPGTGRC